MLPIIIYPHMAFDLSNGGMTVQYYLASILDSKGLDVKMCNVHDNNTHNSIFNKFITVNDALNTNSIVIYCEGVIGNPLQSNYVIRWMLSKLGQNVPFDYHLSWNPNELIYFFNNEIELIHYGNFKQLSVLFVNPIFTDLHKNRRNMCFTIRKNNTNPQIIHTPDSFEITRDHTQNDYYEIFNNHEMFISYDSLSFLSFIAPLCGCISIIYPIQGVSKRDYFKKTPFYQYMLDKNIDVMYGIAYGNSKDEIKYSQDTMHLVKDQLNDFNNWSLKFVHSFTNDLQHWESNTNTKVNYIDYITEKIDIDFYRSYYKDLSHMTDNELVTHYNNFGKKEGRFISSNDLVCNK